MIEVKREEKKIHKNRLEGNRFHCNKRDKFFNFSLKLRFRMKWKAFGQEQTISNETSVYIRQFLVIVVVIPFFYRLLRNFSRLCSSRHRSFILYLSFYIDYVSLQRIVYYIVNERGENRIDSKCQVIFEIDVNISKSIRSKEANVFHISNLIHSSVEILHMKKIQLMHFMYEWFLILIAFNLLS